MVTPPILVILAVLLLASYQTMVVGLVTVVVSAVTYICCAKRIFERRDDPLKEDQMAPMKNSREDV